MASKVKSLYLFSELICYISFVFAATIITDRLDLTVPNDADNGYIITKLGCSSTGLTVRVDGDSELFHQLFSIDDSGNLVVSSDLSPYLGQYFSVSVFSINNCFDNAAFQRTLSIFIQNSKDYLNLENRIYHGFLKKNSNPGLLVEGLERIGQNDIFDPTISCSLKGDNSELFKIVSTGVQLNSEIPQENIAFYFTLQCVNGETNGHAGIHISITEDTNPNDEKSAYNSPSLNNDVNSAVRSFDQGSNRVLQEAHSRVRRDTIVKTLSVKEDAINILVLESPSNASGLQWSISQDETSTFQVSSSGQLSVKTGKALDYDYGIRSYVVGIVVKSADGLTVLRTYQINIQVTDKNDERPVITNRPVPFQATVDPGASVGTSVYQMTAFDPDTTADITFLKVTPTVNNQGSDNFDVEPNTGLIKTKVKLNPNQNYVVQVYAKDNKAEGGIEQRSDTVSVNIYTGFLKPQFNETSYTAKVTENNQPDQSFDTLSPSGTLSLVYAINFQKKVGGNTEYTVLDGILPSNKFKIDSAGRLVTLTPLNYEKDPLVFNLQIEAKDTQSQLKTTVNLTVQLQDVNEYNPTFTLSTYTKTISESLPVGSSILTVTATDEDLNTVLKFWVSEPLFRIESNSSNTGILKVNGTLDYDGLQSHRYEFDVYVQDNGQPPRTSQAKILIDLTNENDEAPQFQDDKMVTTIKDNISPGTNIYRVQAVDLDGDVVSYSFSPSRTLTSDIFEINAKTGQIQFRLGASIPSSRDQYILTVLAADDGSCCGSVKSLTNTSSVTINIVDAVNTKPSFTQCSSYQPSVMENKPIGTTVITVSATDTNRGDNGVVQYNPVNPSNGQPVYFAINQTTGVVTTTAVLDREGLGSKYLFFTVLAKDKGQPPGDDYCTFPIIITDDNDNSPEFGSSSFEGSVLRTSAINTVVMTVKATDKDIGPNADVTYQEVQNSPFFNINLDTGVITVAQALNSAPASITFTIRATDKGTPPRNSTIVTIVISVTNDDGAKPPVWSDPNPIFSVNETSAIDTLVGSLVATSQIVGSAGVTFSLIANGQAGSQTKPFRIMTDATNRNKINILILDPLDYETVKEYTNYLQLRAKDTSKEVYTDVFPKILVIDQNDEIPKFAGADPFTTYIEASVMENRSPPAVVATVAATDADINPNFRKLTYSLFGPTAVNFTINSTTGVISTKVVFDREATVATNYYYLLQVRVDDGFPSARPNMNGEPNSDTATVRVKIGDENDNAPVFDKKIYYDSVKEDAFISSVVTTVQAMDPDDAVFQYSIASNSPGAAFFSIKTRQLQGEIVVAGNLDYENGAHAYNLTVIVDDGIYTAQTTVEISIIDVNDNPPVFNQTSYIIDSVTEEVVYTPSNPKFLLKAYATDPDKFRDKGMEYRISGDADVTNLFQIDSTTGVLNLVGKLDRDRPNGKEVYQFNLLAIDEPGSETRLTGYATVQIRPKDINDNAPIFIPPSPTGSVFENSAVDTPVMAVYAEDYDAGINAQFTYEMITGTESPRSAFRITPDGQVFTTVNNLDREQESVFTFQIRATDKGTDPKAQSSTATATINIKDINDNPPQFEKKVYTISIPETHTGQVLTIKANDPDVDDILKYTLNQDAYKHFTMTTQGRLGIVGVFNGSNPDYEIPSERFFNFTATVFDGRYTDTTNIQITIEDVNDEVPTFVIKNLEKTFEEGPGTAINTEMATFTATDRDTGENGRVRYFISGKPINEDPRKYFSLEDFINSSNQPSTRVKLIRLLDRETIAKHTVYILAIDSGYPELTGTATLTINVKDINDEYPRIKVPYATILEGSPINTLFTTVLGQDPDLPENGPPFGFQKKPCFNNNEDQCRFDLEFLASLDNNNGGANIRSKEVFDREQQKFYYLPIIMWDKRGVPGAVSMTGTNTLTIEIGDINDNHHGPGTQIIHVYNYKGMFKNIQIGVVNYADLDDNDIKDKTFTYIGPDAYKKFFSVDTTTGMVTMLYNVPTGTWQFTVSVYDKHFQETAVSTVIVNIDDMAEEAPYRSGSVRLKGTTPQMFITPDSNGKSPYDKFRERLATSLGTDKDNVQIISVVSPKTGYTDVRFSAHGSPYYSPTKMNGAILRDKMGFQQDSGATIEMVNIDECLQETCESGCYNFLNVTGKPNLVNIRGNSVVGVETFVQGKCGCRTPVSQTDCDPTYCFNGGTCQKDYWNVLSCECLAGFDGPRCQSTRHGFDGTGYALYQPLEQCENSETSIEFITTQDNGLIFYNGPVTDNFDPSDYISLELVNGYPKLKVDHGSGALNLTITSAKLNGGSRLSDGKWHHVNILKRGKLITMTIDYCKAIQPAVDGIVDDRTACEVTASTPGDNMFLNVNGPLQMGGRYTQPNLPSGMTNNKFKGCVRNLVHNSELYDLYTGSETYPGSTDGCPREDDVCNKNSVNVPKKCGDNGDCQITDYNTGATICVCHSMYRGDNCEIETSIKDLYTINSFLDWTLETAFKSLLSQWDTDIHVMYRTRDTDGVIFHVSSPISTEMIRLEIVSNRLQVLYNLGDGNHAVSLDTVPASDGQWHVVIIKRRGKFLSLAMDNGEGPRYSDTQGPDYGHHLFEVKQDQIYAGGALNYDHSPTVVDKDLNSTCLRDIRLARGWFPVTTAENLQNTYIKLKSFSNVRDGCVRDDCKNVVCKSPFICRPLWESYDCVCPLHYVKVGDKCVEYDYCGILTPCHPDATCDNNPSNIDYGYDCLCQSGWSGRTCYTAPQVVDTTDTAALQIALPIIAALILIVLIVALIWFKVCRTQQDVLIEDEKEDYEVRENVMDYDEEGAGEDDYEGHITGLGKLPDPSHFDKPVRVDHLNRGAPPHGGPGIGDFIGDRLDDANDDSGAPPYDTVKEFTYEGGGSDAGSLSSLNTSTSGGDQDYDYLNEWGPKFAKLADMYNNPNYEDSD